MNPIFKKLNFKEQPVIHILDAPETFRIHVEDMRTLTVIKTKLEGTATVDFVLAFVTKQVEVDGFAKNISSRLNGDAIIWLAYPKGTSKRYKCEFNRDNGWAEMGKLGLEPVRMVAIDEDWSALRFRKASHIKTMTRSFAISEEGKKKTAEKKRK
jgi:hypothetical protein